MAWFFLVIAGIFEIVWAILLKYSHGFTRPVFAVLTVIGMIVSFFFLSLALKNLPLGTAYAIWTGIGAVGTVILGVFLFGEAATPTRLALILLIIAGIVGLKITA